MAASYNGESKTNMAKHKRLTSLYYQKSAYQRLLDKMSKESVATTIKRHNLLIMAIGLILYSLGCVILYYIFGILKQANESIWSDTTFLVSIFLTLSFFFLFMFGVAGYWESTPKNIELKKKRIREKLLKITEEINALEVGSLTKQMVDELKMEDERQHSPLYADTEDKLEIAYSPLYVDTTEKLEIAMSKEEDFKDKIREIQTDIDRGIEKSTVEPEIEDIGTVVGTFLGIVLAAVFVACILASIVSVVLFYIGLDLCCSSIIGSIVLIIAIFCFLANFSEKML